MDRNSLSGKVRKVSRRQVREVVRRLSKVAEGFSLKFDKARMIDESKIHKQVTL